ncbi:MAG: hypothetical protein AB7O24_26565 [Kofleriaceae bacterium]
MTRAVLLACLVIGCGLGPEADPVNATSSGIAPWRELGPARVCLDRAGFAPPSSPPGGLCVPGAAEQPSACTDSSECDSRESCVCGVCTIAYCATSSDCDAPRICNFSEHRCDLPCSSNDQCGDTAECIGGICRGRCASTVDCQHGEFCDDAHVCYSDDCSADTDCLGLERCEIQRIPRQVLEPSSVNLGGEVALYLDVAIPGLLDQRAIWRAVSRDGVRFTVDPALPVLDDAASVRAPSVVIDRGTTYVYFEYGDGLELRVASSADGIMFGAPITVLTGPDIHAPAAIHVGDDVVLYYERAGSIALATGPIGGAVEDRGVVLSPSDVQVGDGTPGTPFWTPVTELASPQAMIAGPSGAELIRVWFVGFGQESGPATKFGEPMAIPPNYSIGFAAASVSEPAALSVWPYGPVVDRVEAFLEHREELAPSVVELPTGFRLYLVDASRDPGPGLTLGRLTVLTSEPQ